jgi:hypothetical protein
MFVADMIAWFTLLISMFLFGNGVVQFKDKKNKTLSCVFLVGYLITFVAYFFK